QRVRRIVVEDAPHEAAVDPDREASGRARGRLAADSEAAVVTCDRVAEAREVAAREDGVGADEQERLLRSRRQRALDRVRGAEHLRLHRVADVEPEGRPVARQRLDLVAEVAHDDRRARTPRGRELPKEGRQDGLSVDRERRLRVALRQREQAPSLPRRHHDGLHYGNRRSTSSRIAAAMRPLGAFAIRRSPSRPTSTTSLSGASKPTSVRETSLKTIRSTAFAASFSLARSSPRSPLSAAKPTR